MALTRLGPNNSTNITGINLTSQVTGTLPAANGGTGATSFTAGSLNKISSATASASASLSFNLTTATYDNFLLVGHKIRPATDGAEAYIYFSEDSGSSYLSTTMYSGRDYVKMTGGSSTGAEQNDLSGAAQLATDLGNDGDGSCQIWLYGMANAYSGANKFCNATWTDDVKKEFKFQYNKANIVDGDLRLAPLIL